MYHIAKSHGFGYRPEILGPVASKAQLFKASYCPALFSQLNARCTRRDTLVG